jgi:hypothetical protein
MNKVLLKNISIFLFLLSAFFCRAQENSTLVVNEIYSLSKKEKLSTDAYDVFKTNKFLNFKNKQTLIEKIEGSVYKSIDLKKYFSVQKDWEEIEKEDINAFEKDKKSEYSFQNNVMTETKTEYGSYEVRREIKTVYNAKCFVLLYEKKYYVGSNYNRTESVVNDYDNQNRVVKITRRTEYPKKENNTESVITVKYENDIVNISSENGNILCQFTAK